MNNILENVIATIIVGTLSTVAGVILQATGLSAQRSLIAATLFLLTLVLLFLAMRRYYPLFARRLTEGLLESALRIKANETDEDRTAFRKKIVERVLLVDAGVELNQNSSVVEFLSQQACESHIHEASRNARKVKILTIRGEKYFVGSRSLLHHLCSSKRATVKILVLSPDTQHITPDLATKLDHDSSEEIKEKMRNALQNLKFHARRNKNFEVKCYDGTPNFKILLFDEMMFVSAFISSKNDHNAKMFKITQEGEPLFTGLERHFDDLWERSVSPN